MGEGLVFGEDGVMRGEGVKKLQKTQPRESDIRIIRETTNGNAMQHWFPDAFIRLKFVMTSDWGILMYLACTVLARSWLKRETIHKNSISKTGHPVILKFQVEQSGLEWHPNHMDVLEAEIDLWVDWSKLTSDRGTGWILPQINKINTSPLRHFGIWALISHGSRHVIPVKWML